MKLKIVDIHTHNPTQGAITLTSRGVHPWRAQDATLPLMQSTFEGVDAVGEIGLDFCCAVDRSMQQHTFEAQLEIAQHLGKIVVIHCVKAYSEVLSTLRRYTLRCVIFHGFIGSPQLMRDILSRGYYISFGYRTLSSPKSVEALRQMPLSRLFLESDEGKQSIESIYAWVSELLGMDEPILRRVIYSNYKEILK